MSASHIVQSLISATDTLRGEFPDASAVADETISQYSSAHPIPDAKWLEDRLSALAPPLLSAGFIITLKLTIPGQKLTVKIQEGMDGLVLRDPALEESEVVSDSLPPNVVEAINELKALITQRELKLDDLSRYATGLPSRTVQSTNLLELYLDKATLNSRIVVASALDDPPDVITFLFQDALRRNLKTTTVDRLETEFFKQRKLALLIVFDLEGGLAGDFLLVCGRKQVSEVDELLSKHLSAESVRLVENSHRFRRAQSLGNFAPKWLLPELFALTVTHGNENDSLLLRRQLQISQPVLAALFMGDMIEADAQGVYSVEYRGLRPRQFKLDTDQLVAADVHWDKLYELYRYAYDGLSSDKLEIAQQFISQFAEDFPTLCSRATEIREASKKTYDRALIAKVEEYFDARQTVQERIQTAVAELTNDVITLTREVSSDLYKALGIIALAIAGWFFKADVGLAAIFLGFLAIAIYLFIVLLYHLPTLKEAADLRSSQHEAYINSFSDVLSDVEIKAFIANPYWAEARTTFDVKHSWAGNIYFAFCFISIIVVFAVTGSMWFSTPQIPPVKLH